MELNGTQKATILIVDDNPTNLRVLLDYLKEAGHKTLIARSGEGALQQVEFARPDLILLDVMMAGIDGFETCRRLKALETGKDIPVIFLTALTETADKMQGFEAGGVDYITKPLQHEEVLARVNTHLTIRRLQQQLQSQNAQLHELNANKDKFFSIIAHDLRSPLSAVLGIARMMTEHLGELAADDLAESVHDLRDAVENLYVLLDNLLTWSRLQRGLMEQQPQSLDLRQLTERNIALFTANASQKQIMLKNLLDEPVMAYGDENMVNTVLRNLISNALKFTKPQGAITISASSHDHEVEMTVADSGVGMNAEKVAQLFRIDAKHHGIGTAGEKGTGLGLNLCKDLLERNGGRIWLESTLGQGTTFHFTLRKEAAPDGQTT